MVRSYAVHSEKRYSVQTTRISKRKLNVIIDLVEHHVFKQSYSASIMLSNAENLMPRENRTEITTHKASLPG